MEGHWDWSLPSSPLEGLRRALYLSRVGGLHWGPYGACWWHRQSCRRHRTRLWQPSRELAEPLSWWHARSRFQQPLEASLPASLLRSLSVGVFTSRWHDYYVAGWLQEWVRSVISRWEGCLKYLVVHLLLEGYPNQLKYRWTEWGGWYDFGKLNHRQRCHTTNEGKPSWPRQWTF